MLLSERKISEELAFYRALNNRSRLSKKEAKQLSILERGYIGECTYDEVFDEIGHGSVFVLRDIYLQVEGGVAQYDALIISDSGIVVNEVKNFSGDYRYEEGKWYYGQHQIPDDAIAQLKRAVGKLLRVKYNMNLNFEVTGKIVFPHVEFRLNSNNGELWDLVVMRAGLRKYLKEFRYEHISARAEKIAEAIAQLIVVNPYFNKCADFDTVRKGLYCGVCGGFELMKSHFYMECKNCRSKEKKETHLIRAMSDFKSLFLKDKMTKKRFMEFIDYKVSSRTALRILDKYCDCVANGAHTYYIFKYHDFDEVYKKYEVSYRYKDKK